MKFVDLDQEFVNLCCFLVAALIVVLAQFSKVQDDRVYTFANLSAGAALRGFGTGKNNER